MSKDLNELIHQIWGKYNELDNTVNTWCNVFLAEVMGKLDYHAFDGRVANRIVEILEFDRFKWEKITAESWDRKSLVVAGLKGEVHGHVCILIDGEYETSGKWKKQVPLCANIGKKNSWGKGVNWSFVTEPNYYRFTKYKITST